VGHRFARVEQRRKDLRFPFPERFRERLEGQEVTALGRRAKYLLADLSSGEVLVMHLGMSGRFLVTQSAGTTMPGEFHHRHGGESAHDHVVFHLSNGARVTYNDARRFGFMDLVPRAGLGSCRHFAGMGIEPLGNELSGEAIARLFKGKRTPLKAALLDQRLVAGLGNIYVCEALHMAGIAPGRAAGRISRQRLARLVEAVGQVLRAAIEAGGSTLRDYARPDGELGYFSKQWRVYGREGEACACGARIRRRAEGGRSTFFCASCQR
jgi:formamidopyrimidine-DNA glycosylase